ncbi:hypothetical protein B0H14DRAFT_2672163 [Mycena olivaceomarginata]|nr:hypothetical protein B0H14DRAFT_2672163 [Mycena olivaceomarginata]
MLVASRFQVWLEPLLYRHLILATYEKVKRLLRCCDQSGLGDKLASLVETLTIREIDGSSTDAVRLLGICIGARRLRLSIGTEKQWILDVCRLPRLREVTLHCSWNSLPSTELVERLLELWAGVVVTVELSHGGPTNSSSWLQGLDPRIMVVRTDSLPPRLRVDDPVPRRRIPPRPVRRF